MLWFTTLIDTIGSTITGIGYLRKYKLKEGDIVVDAGAYRGWFSLYAANKVGSTGKVIAFEPSQKNYEILKKRGAKAKFGNVICIKKGLYNEKATLKMEKEGILPSSGQTSEKSEGESITTDTLDKILKDLRIRKIDFIKMDIEGAELEALEGAPKSLQIAKNLAIACYHKRNGKSTGENLASKLKALGFKTAIGYPLHQTLYATKV